MTKKWYKQFWPWFLIAIPASSMMVGTLLMYFATGGKDSLVSGDYYKEGKAINQSFDKQRKARELGLIALLDIQQDAVTLTFEGAQPPDKSAIKLEFFHTTLEELDFSVLLTSNNQGEYTAKTQHDFTGKWRLTISAFDESWKIRKQVFLTQESILRLEP